MAEFENAGNLIAKQIASQPSRMEQATQALSLVDLGNKIQAAPMEREAKLLENQIKQSEVEMIPLRQMKAQVDLDGAKADERRKNSSFYFDHLEQMARAFDDDFSQGEFALAHTIPGAKAKELEDGSVSITAPQPGGGVKVFKFHPGRSKRNPEQIANDEAKLRSDWEKQGSTFVTVDQNLRAMKQLALDPTGPGDTALLVYAAKAWDPGSVAREGEVETIKNTANLPTAIQNAWNQHLKDPNSASLGPKDSPLRKQIIDTVEKKAGIMRDDLSFSAKKLAPVWRVGGLNPQKIYTPLGSLDIFADEKKKIAPPGAPPVAPAPGVGPNGPEAIGTRGPGTSAPQSAAPGQAAQPSVPAPKPKYNLRNQTGTFVRQFQNKSRPQ